MVSFETRVLDRLKVRAAAMITREFMLRPEASLMIDHDGLSTQVTL